MSPTVEDVRRLIAAVPTGSTAAARDRALVAVLYWGALRLAEALALTPADLDASAGAVRVRSAPGSGARAVALEPEALAIVSEWLDRRREILGSGEDDPLLCTLRGGRLDPSYVRALLPRLAARAGLAAPVNASGLRKARTAALVAQGRSPAAIQAELGHASLAGTRRYLRSLGAGPSAPEQAEARLEAAVASLREAARGEAAPWLIFSLIAQEAARLTGTEVAVVKRFQPNGTARGVGAWADAKAPSIEELASRHGTVPLDTDGAIARVYREGRPVRTDDLSTLRDESARTMARLGFRSALAAPLPAGSVAWGALSVATSRPTPPPPGTEDYLGRFLQRLAPIVETVDADLRRPPQERRQTRPSGA